MAGAVLVPGGEVDSFHHQNHMGSGQCSLTLQSSAREEGPLQGWGCPVLMEGCPGEPAGLREADGPEGAVRVCCLGRSSGARSVGPLCRAEAPRPTRAAPANCGFLRRPTAPWKGPRSSVE